MSSMVLFLSGSPSRQRSRSDALADRIRLRTREAGHAVVPFSIRDVPAEVLVGASRESDAALAFGALVARSSAVVVATPVYNASMAGGLKALLDLLPQRAFLGKPVLPLATGGSAGHQLAIDYGIRPVLSALGADHVLPGVFACDADVMWTKDADAAPGLSVALADRLDQAADALVSLLSPSRQTVSRSRLPARVDVVPASDELFAGERCSA